MSPSDDSPPGVRCVRAPNASALTLDGTNSYVVAAWTIDPGPADEGHLAAVLEAAGGRLHGIALTHSHPDHAEGARRLSELAGGVPIVLAIEGERVGPLTAIATPGHAPDHVALLHDRIAFVGDTVMGTGSVFIDPREGSLSDYLASLARLRALELDVLCPGHGPYVWDPSAKLDEYIAHRLDRERALVAALEHGARSEAALLDGAWADVGPQLRPVAGLSLRAHLHKLAEEDRLPPDLEAGLVD